MPSTVRRRDWPRRLPSFAAVAGVAGVLAAGLIRDNLQAHLAPARVGEQPPSSTPTSLSVRTTFHHLARAASRRRETLGNRPDRRRSGVSRHVPAIPGKASVLARRRLAPPFGRLRESPGVCWTADSEQASSGRVWARRRYRESARSTRAVASLGEAIVSSPPTRAPSVAAQIPVRNPHGEAFAPAESEILVVTAGVHPTS